MFPEIIKRLLHCCVSSQRSSIVRFLFGRLESGLGASSPARKKTKSLRSWRGNACANTPKVSPWGKKDKFRLAQPTILGESRDISALKHTCDILVFVNMVPCSAVAFLECKNLSINGCLDKKLAKCHQNWIGMGVFQQQITYVRVETCRALKKCHKSTT